MLLLLSIGLLGSFHSYAQNWAINVGDIVYLPGSNASLVLSDATIENSHSLTVDGTMKSEGIKVITDVFPDYVFEIDYELLPLAELENYIWKEHHLPDIPSAKELADTGINLKEMNLKLVEKVEELTLYTIQQEKNLKEISSLSEGVLKKLEEQEKMLNRLEKHTALD